MWTLYLLMGITITTGACAYLLFLWSVKRGQYEDPEGPKYRMLDDDDEEVRKSPPK
jgi:cbb3-type cytochrome oxidase maturation protein